MDLHLCTAMEEVRKREVMCYVTCSIYPKMDSKYINGHTCLYTVPNSYFLHLNLHLHLAVFVCLFTIPSRTSPVECNLKLSGEQALKSQIFTLYNSPTN